VQEWELRCKFYLVSCTDWHSCLRRMSRAGCQSHFLLPGSSPAGTCIEHWASLCQLSPVTQHWVQLEDHKLLRLTSSFHQTQINYLWFFNPNLSHLFSCNTLKYGGALQFLQTSCPLEKTLSLLLLSSTDWQLPLFSLKGKK